MPDDARGILLWLLTDASAPSMLSVLTTSASGLSKIEVRDSTLTWRFPTEAERDALHLPMESVVDVRLRVLKRTHDRIRGDFRVELCGSSPPLHLGPFFWQTLDSEATEALYDWVARGIVARAQHARGESVTVSAAPRIIEGWRTWL